MVVVASACKKKQEVRGPDPYIVLDSIVATSAVTWKVYGTIGKAGWTKTVERGIIYEAGGFSAWKSGTRVQISSNDDMLKVEHEIADLPAGKNVSITLYAQGEDEDHYWQCWPVQLHTSALSVSVIDKFSGRGMMMDMGIDPPVSNIPRDKLEIYVGTYKTELKNILASGKIRVLLPDNIPPGKYPIVGKLYSQVAYSQDSITILPGKWTRLANAPFKGRARMAHFVWNNKGFIVGGTLAASNPLYKYKEVWEFDITTRLWTRKNDFPFDIHDAIAFNVNNRIFLIGGTKFNGLKAFNPEIFEYDPAGDTWTSRGVHPQLKTGRSLMAGTALNNKIYIGTGTREGTLYENAIFNSAEWMMYDPATNTWTDLAPVPGAPTRGAACFQDGKDVYLAGGQDINQHVLTSVQKYHVASNTWESLPEIPAALARSQAAVAYVRGVPCLFGGLVDGIEYSNTNNLQRFDFATQKWTEMLPYRTNPNIVIEPWDGTYPVPILGLGLQPAVFPTPAGFILFGGSHHVDGRSYSDVMAEFVAD